MWTMGSQKKSRSTMAGRQSPLLKRQDLPGFRCVVATKRSNFRVKLALMLVSIKGGRARTIRQMCSRNNQID